LRVCALAPDLIAASRIQEAVGRLGGDFARLTTIEELPAPDTIDLLLVDWDMRDASWGRRIGTWRSRSPRVRVLLFGPHADKDAHASAALDRLGPVMARSAFFKRLDELLSKTRRVSAGK
jgi:GGDEF domain-containing protein